MSTERDVTRVVRSWLGTDGHESADRVLDYVLDRLDTTPQRRLPWPARRFIPMQQPAKLAIGAAAVVALAVVAIRLLPPGPGGPPPTPTPAITASPLPSPTEEAAMPPRGALAGGRHGLTLNGVRLSFAVPGGWSTDGEFGMSTGTIGPSGVGVIWWTSPPIAIFSDPCTQTSGPELGSDIDTLAAAVAAVPGMELVSGPTDLTVDGYPAKLVVQKVPATIGCDAQDFYLWHAKPAEMGRYAVKIGTTIRSWIIDVEGKVVWIDGETYEGADDQPGMALTMFINSIRFE